MSDKDTRERNMIAIRNRRLSIVNSLNQAISDMLYITTTEEVEATNASARIDKLAMAIIPLKTELATIPLL
jgi:hypothetical protein